MRKISILLTIFLSGCKCFYYYSYDSRYALVNENLLNLECRINSYPVGETDELEISIDYKDSSYYKIVRNSLRIYPIVNGKKDTLKLKTEYASHFYFTFYKNWPETIDLNLGYDEDSLGTLRHKIVFIKGLAKGKNCEAGFVPH